MAAEFGGAGLQIAAEHSAACNPRATARGTLRVGGCVGCGRGISALRASQALREAPADTAHPVSPNCFPWWPVDRPRPRGQPGRACGALASTRPIGPLAKRSSVIMKRPGSGALTSLRAKANLLVPY